jgi:hypothetical protein
MKLQRLIFFAVVFCALLGYVVIIDSPAPQKTKPAAPQLVRVFSFPETAITGIEIRKGAVQATLFRRDRLWEISVPSRATLQQDQADSLLSTIAGLIKIETVEKQAAALGQYGLEKPVMSLTVSCENAQPVTLLIGDTCPTGVSMYAMIQGSKEVIQIGTLLRFSIDTLLEMYTRPASR